MEFGKNGTWWKPRHWYERSDEDGIQTACSRECIDKISEKSGKTNQLPITGTDGRPEREKETQTSVKRQ